MKSIVVTIDEDGNTEIKAVGYRGSSCEKATAELEKALGKVGKRTKTPEYHQQAETVAHQRAGT